MSRLYLRTAKPPERRPHFLYRFVKEIYKFAQRYLFQNRRERDKRTYLGCF